MNEIPANRLIELVPVARVCHVATAPQRGASWATRPATALCGRSSYFRGGDDVLPLCVECARKWGAAATKEES